MPPEIARALDEMAEIAVDDWQEQRHAHEVVVVDVDDTDDDGDLRTVVR